MRRRTTTPYHPFVVVVDVLVVVVCVKDDKNDKNDRATGVERCRSSTARAVEGEAARG